MDKISGHTPNDLSGTPIAGKAATGRAEIEAGAKPELSPTEAEIFTILGQFLLFVLPSGFQVMQGQQNRTPAPSGSFATMMLTKREQLATNSHIFPSPSKQAEKSQDDPECYRLIQPQKITILVHLFGVMAGDGVTCLQILFRDQFATKWFADHGTKIMPLYTDSPQQIPFQTAESQYESHWRIELLFQAETQILMSQDSAIELNPTFYSLP